MNNINLHPWVFKAKRWKESWCLAPIWSKNRAIDKEALDVIASINRFDRIGRGRGSLMGHVRGGLGVYGTLQKRLNRYSIGAPSTRELYEILQILFAEEDAFVASRMPIRFFTIDRISRLTRKSTTELRPLLDRMADRGLVMDFEKRGKTYYILSPTLLGFFEFTFMRVREDIPQKRLASLMWNYAHENADVIHGIFSGKTQPGRALVYEDSL